LIAKKGSNKYLLINISFEEKKMSNKKVLSLLIFLIMALVLVACSVARYGGGLLNAIEVRDCLKSRVSDEVAPEVLGSLKPEAYANHESCAQQRQRQHQCPSDWSGRAFRGWRLCGRIEREVITPALLLRSRIPAVRPCIQVGLKRIN
jgi:hypothetical protein